MLDVGTDRFFFALINPMRNFWPHSYETRLDAMREEIKGRNTYARELLNGMYSIL